MRHNRKASLHLTREECWNVAPLTRTLLRHITRSGYSVSVHRNPGSLYGMVESFVEMYGPSRQCSGIRCGCSRGNSMMRSISARCGWRRRWGLMWRSDCWCADGKAPSCTLPVGPVDR